MRRLIAKLVALAAVPLVVAAAIVPPMAVEGVRIVSPFRYHLLRARFVREPVRAVALGDSQAAMGFQSPDPAIQSFAFAGENVRETAIKARYLRPRLPALSTVLVEAQPHMFFPHRDWPVRGEYAALLSSGARADDPYAMVFDRCCRGAIVGVTLRRFFGIPVPPPIPEVGPTGHLRYPAILALSEPLEVGARREIGKYGGTHPLPALRAVYEALLAELRQDGLDVVLTRYPMSPAYRATIDPAALGEADRYFRQLEDRYGARACGGWDAVRDPELFFDADHLNEAGARAYWPIVAPCATAERARRTAMTPSAPRP